MNLNKLVALLLYQHSPLLPGAVGVLLVWMLARMAGRHTATLRIGRVCDVLLPPISRIFVCGAIAAVVLELFYPTFVDIGDLGSPAVSYLVSKGQPLYHSVDYPERYSCLYGPMSFLLTAGCFRLFGASVFTSKLAHSALILLLFGAAWKTLRRIGRQPIEALAVFMVVMTPVFFVAAPITFCAITGAALFYLSRWPCRFVIIGILLGVACNFKIHSGVYFCPILMNLLFQGKWRDLLALSAASAVTLLSPFLLPMISLRNYLFWLTAAGRHGISLAVFFHQVDWLLYLFSVVFAVILAYWLAKPLPAAETRGAWGSFVGSVIAIVVILVVASKVGSGYHHLFALIPSIVLLAIPASRKLAAWAESRTCQVEIGAFAKLYLLGILCLGLLALAHSYYEILRIPAAAITSDLEVIMQRYPHARIELGDGETSEGEQYARPASKGRFAGSLLVFKGNPLLYEWSALMDMQRAGLEIPPQTIEKLRAGYVDIWLFPKGRTPFNIINWYDHQTPLFPPEFQKAFFEEYHYRETTEFYDVWISNISTAG